MIVDEIQTGMARTGRWFGFEHDGVAPDVVTLAKALGNGMPVGACWARDDVAAVFEPGDHGSTYSATAIATAAVNAVIAEMRRIDAPAVAAKQGERLATGCATVPGVATVRGRGLLLGAELDGRPSGDVGRRAARQRSRRQRRDANGTALRPADHGHRRGDRRGAGDLSRTVLG